MSTVPIPASYYQQFDADYSLNVPAHGYGGWKKKGIEIALDRTAVVLMHAWDTGTYAQFAGWHRACEWIPRARSICRTVLPELLAAVRASDLPLLHVVGGGSYYQDYPGYKIAEELAGPAPEPLPRVEPDPVYERLKQFKSDYSFVGARNQDDVGRGFQALDFPAEAGPQGREGIAANGDQLFALCSEKRVNHLVYAGFMINWCLLLSPGGMADMQKRGFMCSALRQAVTAVENKETAEAELCKKIALWRVALAFGFVFDVDDFIAGIAAGQGG